ncbi:MAG: lysostaphin resistance A-like protein, partial [Candidatus Acidiferrales bacterium]
QYNAFFAVPVQVTYYLLLLLLLDAVVRRRRLSFGPALALRALTPAPALLTFVTGFTLALVIQVANFLVPPPRELAIDRMMSTRASAELVIAAALLVAPLVEELLFRGYIYTLLEGLWGSNRAVVTSGLLFGALHAPQLWPGYFQMALLCVVGLIFSLTRARTGSTTASISLHFAYNGTISLLFLLSPTFRALPAVSLPLLALLTPR